MQPRREKMLALEESQQQLSLSQKELGDVETRNAKLHGDLGKEQKALKEDVQRLNGEWEAVGGGITAEDMTAYEKLRKTKAGLAVAKVKDKVCTACGTTLSHSLAQAARSPKEIEICPTCRRIIYTG